MSDFKAMRQTIDRIESDIKGPVDEMKEAQEKINSFINNDMHAFSERLNTPTQNDAVKEADPGTAAPSVEDGSVNTDMRNMYEEYRQARQTPIQSYYDMYKPYQQARQQEVEMTRQALPKNFAEGYNMALAKDTPAELDQLLFEYDQKIKDGDEEFFYNLKEGFIQSEMTQMLANEAYRKMMGMPNEYDKINDFMDSHPELYPTGQQGLLKESTRSASNFLGFMWGGTKEGIDDALVTGMGLAGIAATATTPLAPVSIPGAFLSGVGAGMSKGVYENMVVTEAGLNYIDMINEGVDPDIARNTSLMVGAINGMIESAQMVQLTYGTGIQAATGAAKDALGGASKRAVVRRLVEAAAEIGITASEEAVEEMVQEMTSIESVKFAMYLQNQRDKEGGEPTSFKPEDFAGDPEKADQVLATGVQTLQGSMWLGGARVGAGAAVSKSIDFAANKKLEAERAEMLYTNIPAVLDDYEAGNIEINNQDRADIMSVLKNTAEIATENPRVKAKDKEQARVIVDRINKIENATMEDAKTLDSRIVYAPANTEEIEAMFMADDFNLKSVETGNKITENTIAAYKQAKKSGVSEEIWERWINGDAIGAIANDLKNTKAFKKMSVLDVNMLVDSTIKMQKEFQYQSAMNAANNLSKAAEIKKQTVSVTELADDTREVDAKTPFGNLKNEQVSLAKIFVDSYNFKYSDSNNVSKIVGMTAWEDESGDLYLAGGYPAYLNFKQGQANKVPVVVLRNDEYTHQEADVLTSLVDLMEGNSGSIDFAQMMRNNDISEETAGEIAEIAKSAGKPEVAFQVEEGVQLSMLDDDAFADVLARKESPEQAITKAVEAVEVEDEAKAVKEVVEGEEEVVERKEPKKVDRAAEVQVRKEKLKQKREITIEQVLEQDTLKVLYENRAKKQKTYQKLKPIVDAAKKNPFLRGISMKFVDRAKTVTLTRKELNEVDYIHYEPGTYEIYGETTNVSEDGETGQIVLYSGASKDAILEEIIHALQLRLGTIDPELNAMISAWEKEVYATAIKEGYTVPGGIELFAQSFVFSEAGYANNYPDLANLVAIPDEISGRFKQILNATGDGRKAIFELARGDVFPDIPKKLRNINPDIDYNKVLAESVETIDKKVANAQTDMMNLLQRNGAFVAVDPRGTFAIVNQKEQMIDGKRMANYSIEYFDEATNSVRIDEYVSSKDMIDDLTDGGYSYLFRKPKKKPSAKAAYNIKPINSLTSNKENDNIVLAKPGTDREAVRFHAGDLGIAETYWRMRGKRGTGHFGTGTYFVKNVENLGSYTMDRPVHEIDTSGLNLFKLETKQQYFDLHDGLKYLNRISTEYNGYESVLKEMALGKLNEDSDSDFVYSAQLLARVSEQLTGSKKTTSEMIDVLMPALIYGAQMTRGNWMSSIDPGHTADSPSTVFMKSLGFDGVDTNGVDGIDNTTFGGVIYRKAMPEFGYNEVMAPEEYISDGLVSESIKSPDTIAIKIKDPVTGEIAEYDGSYVSTVEKTSPIDIDDMTQVEEALLDDDFLDLTADKKLVLNTNDLIVDTVDKPGRSLYKLLDYLNRIGVEHLYVPEGGEYEFSLEGTTEADYMYESDEFYNSLEWAAQSLGTDEIEVQLVNGEFYLEFNAFDYADSQYENSYYSLKESNGVSTEIKDQEIEIIEAEPAYFKQQESKLKQSILDSPRFSAELKKIVAQDNFLYTVKANAENIIEAADRIQKNGWESEFGRLSIKELWDENDMAGAILLAERYDDIGEKSKAMKIIRIAEKRGRTAGRVASVMYMFKKYSAAEWLRATQQDFSQASTKAKRNKARKATSDIQDTVEEVTKDEVDKKRRKISNDAANSAKEKLSPEQLLARKISRSFTLPTPPTGVRLMVDTLFKKAKELGVPNRPSLPTDPFGLLADAIENRDEYQRVWTAARDEIFEKYVQDSEVMSQIQEYFAFDPDGKLIVPRSVIKDAIDSALIDMEATIEDIINDYYVLGKNNISPTIDSLIVTVKDKVEAKIGEIGDIEAEALAEIIANEVQAQVEKKQADAIEGLLKKRKFKPKERQTIIDRTLELAKYGAFKDEAYYDAIADKLGIPVMTPELAAFIDSQAKLIQSLESGSKAQLIEIARMHNVIGAQIPGRAMSKLRTFRILMMLFNPKTWIKNITGNTGFSITDTFALQTMGVSVDYLASKFTGRRTRAISMGESMSVQKQAFMKELNEFKTDWKDLGFTDAVAVLRESVDQNKFEFRPRKSFYKGKGPIETVLSQMEDVLTMALLLPDRAAFSAANAESLQNQMIAAGVDVATDEMVEKANLDGLRRTFQDNTILSMGLEKTREVLNMPTDKWFGEGALGLGDLILPFVKTPANLIMRGIDYTPIGLLTGTTKAIFDKRNGVDEHVVQANLVEAYARALTGLTMTLGMGFMLGAKGLATGAQDDDDWDIYYLKQEAGYLNNAINMTGIIRWVSSRFDPEQAKMKYGDVLIDYSWMEPFGLTMSIGVETGIAYKKGLARDLDVSNLMIAALSAGIKTIEEQPMLQGLSDVFGGKYYSSDTGSALVRVVTDTLVNSVSSFTPTLGNYLSIALTNSKSETYDATSQLNTAISQVKKRIPGLSATLPKRYTRFGEEYNYFDEESTAFGRMMSLLINPAIKKTYKPSEEAQFVLDLYESTGETIQAPRKVKRTQTISYRDPDTGETIKTKVTLDNEEYSQLLKYAGDLTKERFRAMMDAGYDRLPSERQAKRMAEELTDIGYLVRDKAAEIKGLK